VPNKSVMLYQEQQKIRHEPWLKVLALEDCHENRGCKINCVKV
jgi:hypothetical protein